MSRVEHLAEGIVLHLGNSLEIMPNLGPVDHVITDPPYEQNAQDRIGGISRKDGGKVTEKLTFAGIDTIRDEVATLTRFKCSGWAIFFCTAEGVAPWRDAIEAAGMKYRSPMIWVKPDAMPKFNGQGPAVGFEAIVTAWCGPGISVWNGGGKRGIFSHLTNFQGRTGEHPTEKPPRLMEELIGLFTAPGDVVLDPFMGSGTTGVACIRHGRNFIGIERDEKFFDLSCRRISDALTRPDLFIDPRPAKTKQEAFL